ncbi:MAG: hypothetical protein HOB22_10355, partial [Candidatus Marinimicrobia bacterium]|nr:hypothetical protein [Candidatus Neomarinimicrobiota bacterium]MBT5225205.1 hypothetical protein [Candidatus Neomarinimicrobiota bacterium]MBT6516650.1 hypothetical protein [Candidatus Neomarinimicrobiota bacterium]MBT6712105.1 hypothetical protein [Candidatus Neomarinimicrobiota bacterium]MBT6981296.1 hypothetical protein [Candidatus Neomarinimicrobiota bacterium]
DAKGNGHPVVIVNDTRDQVEGNFSIKDADTKKVLLSKMFSISANGKLLEDYLPETDETKLWLIEWEVDGVQYKNHYFVFKPHVELDEYLKWLSTLK